MSANSTKPKRKRIGLFFPLLLILIGVFLLLSNLGVVSGNIWNLIWQFWPLLLIVIGLDSIFKREGLVASTFMIGIGVIFLLANLGYLNVSIWQMIFTLWPILIIAIGFDILVARRSIWASIAGMIVIAAILFGSLWLFGTTFASGTLLSSDQFEQSLNGATRAQLILEGSAGEIQVRSTDQPQILLTGSIPNGSNDQVQTSYSISSGNGTYILRDTSVQGFIPFTTTQTNEWRFSITEAIPLELRLGLGAGAMEVDLSRVQLDNLAVNTAVGQTQIVLPEQGRYSAQVTSAIGQIVIIVPRGVGVRVNMDTALVDVDVPDEFLNPGDVYQSSNYESAENRVELSVDLAIGNVVISQE